MVEMTRVSTHGKTKSGTACATGSILGKTTKGHGMFTIVWGTGSKRQSRTMHCSEQEAQNFKDSLKDD